MLSQSWALSNTCNFESWSMPWCLEPRNKIGTMCYYVCCKGAWYSKPYAFLRLFEKKLQWLISTRIWKELRKQLPSSLRTKMKIKNVKVCFLIIDKRGEVQLQYDFYTADYFWNLECIFLFKSLRREKPRRHMMTSMCSDPRAEQLNL